MIDDLLLELGPTLALVLDGEGRVIDVVPNPALAAPERDDPPRFEGWAE